MLRERPVHKARVELTRQCLAQRDHKEQQVPRERLVHKVQAVLTQLCLARLERRVLLAHKGLLVRRVLLEFKDLQDQ